MHLCRVSSVYLTPYSAFAKAHIAGCICENIDIDIIIVLQPSVAIACTTMFISRFLFAPRRPRVALEEWKCVRALTMRPGAERSAVRAIGATARDSTIAGQTPLMPGTVFGARLPSDASGGGATRKETEIVRLRLL